MRDLVSAQDGITPFGIVHMCTSPSHNHLPKVALEIIPKLVYLVEHRSFLTSENTSVISFFHSSFLQAISALMLWSVHVQKVCQASKHLTLPSCPSCRPLVGPVLASLSAHSFTLILAWPGKKIQGRSSLCN